jgi:hypothetical protein
MGGFPDDQLNDFNTAEELRSGERINPADCPPVTVRNSCHAVASALLDSLL